MRRALQPKREGCKVWWQRKCTSPEGATAMQRCCSRGAAGGCDEWQPLRRAGLAAPAQAVRALQLCQQRRGSTPRSWLGRWALLARAAVGCRGCMHWQGTGLLSIYGAVTAAVGMQPWPQRCQGAAGAPSALTEAGEPDAVSPWPAAHPGPVHTGCAGRCWGRRPPARTKQSPGRPPG